MTKKIIYEPTLEKQPELEKLIDLRRYQDKIKKINELNIQDEKLKEFLIFAATRFIRFNFAMIAEYYAHIADVNIRKIFEDLALVIVDYDNRIKNAVERLDYKIRKIVSENKGD